MRNCGRIGTNGQELVEVFATEIEAGQALEAVARAKRRGIGISDDDAAPSEMSLSQELALPEESARYFVVAHADAGRGNRL